LLLPSARSLIDMLTVGVIALPRWPGELSGQH